MQIQYFQETDTLYIQFSDEIVVETADLNANTILDLDTNGNLVAITLEHARSLTNVRDLSFQQILGESQLVPT